MGWVVAVIRAGRRAETAAGGDGGCGDAGGVSGNEGGNGVGSDAKGRAGTRVLGID